MLLTDKIQQIYSLRQGTVLASDNAQVRGFVKPGTDLGDQDQSFYCSVPLFPQWLKEGDNYCPWFLLRML